MKNLKMLTPFPQWPTPKKRGLVASSDLRLFYEALQFISRFSLVSKKQLKEELSVRVKGLKFIEDLSPSGIENLVVELKSFNWIIADRPGIIERSDMGLYRLTAEGQTALELYKQNKREFLKKLIAKMHEQYVIPGWIIDRLWYLNPSGQGQVIIPTPIKDWNPDSRKWEDNGWSRDLREQTINTYKVIQNISPGSFDIPIALWESGVERAWERLSSLRRKKAKVVRHFAPRNRLMLAMKEAAVTLLFGNYPPGSENADFKLSKPPLLPRTYMAWCPRLEELELIFYSDFNPIIPGRIIFPVSVFRKKSGNPTNFEFLEISNLKGDSLALHKPRWSSFRRIFIEVLFTVYQQRYLKKKSLYVSIQNVRDEVNRQLRISSTSFEDFLSILIKESIKGESPLTISIETDVRKDQMAGHQITRRPVLIDGKFCSLIAITKQKKTRK